MCRGVREAADWMTLRAIQESVMTALGMGLGDSTLGVIVRKQAGRHCVSKSGGAG